VKNVEVGGMNHSNPFYFGKDFIVKVHCLNCDKENKIIYFSDKPTQIKYICNKCKKKLKKLK